MDNSVTEAIVLAGGLGTRLRSEIGESPKVLAPVNGKPFLNFVLQFLKNNGIKTVVLAVGYKYEMIENAFGNSFDGMELIYSIEKEPRGTGGAMKLALERTKSDIVFVVNGDTIFNIPLQDLAKFHREKYAVCSIALKKLYKVERYGSIELDEESKIVAFREKEPRDETVINGGIYCINKGVLIHYPVNTPFSFETNYLQNSPRAKKIFGKTYDSYFKDIGVPDDYHEFEKDMLV